MVVPFILMVLSLAGAGLAIWQSGPVLSDGLLLALLMVLASVILFMRAALRKPRHWIVIDGSNVMHWGENGTPALAPLHATIRDFRSVGITPVVWFDANVGYKLKDRYMGAYAMARALDLPVSQVRIAPSGTPADPLLLQEAVRLGARVVTNDRFRDWAETHPEVERPGFLLHGRMAGNGVSLDVDPRTEPARARG
ncbi:MAG: hypothetical protein RQ750_06030 [Roseovarius sp.]|nr:hypothetical protein [Roseovarius sp.]